MDYDELCEYVIETNNLESVSDSDIKVLLPILAQKRQESLLINLTDRVNRITKLIRLMNNYMPIPEAKKPKPLSQENREKLRKTTENRPRIIVKKESSVPRQTRKKKVKKGNAKKTKKQANKKKQEQEIENTPKNDYEEEFSELNPTLIHQEEEEFNEESYIDEEVTLKPALPTYKDIKICRYLTPEQIDKYNEIIDDLLYNDKEIESIDDDERQELLFAINKRKNLCLAQNDYTTPKQLDELYDTLTTHIEPLRPKREQKLDRLYREREAVERKIDEVKQIYKEKFEKLKEAHDTEEELLVEDIEMKKFREVERIQNFRDRHRKTTFPEVEQLYADQILLAKQRNYSVLQAVRKKAEKLERELEQKEEQRLAEIAHKQIQNLQRDVDSQTKAFSQRWDSHFKNLQLELETEIHKLKAAYDGITGLIDFYERILREQPNK